MLCSLLFLAYAYLNCEKVKVVWKTSTLRSCRVQFYEQQSRQLFYYIFNFIFI